MDDFREIGTQMSTQTPELDCHQSGEFAKEGSSGIESISTEWTDEKHSLYLKSMETSFVEQLYNSVDFPVLLSQRKNGSDHVSSSQIDHTPSGQFKVLRGGCWQKINFERPECQPKRVHRSRSRLLENPWIQHYRSTCQPQKLPALSPSKVVVPKSQAVRFNRNKTVICGAATSSEQFDACCSNLRCHDLVGGETEVSDQNFIDEEVDIERKSNTCRSKKMKTQTIDASSHDQVVPSRNPPTDRK